MMTDMMAIVRNSENNTRNLWLGLMVLLAFLSLEACNKETESEDVRPVRNMVIETHMTGDLITLTGQLNARHDTKLAFRLSGKLVERLVTIGDIVKADQIVAKLDAKRKEIQGMPPKPIIPQHWLFLINLKRRKDAMAIWSM
jgi:multidrug efflux pump subunit AcrA (membrane-fusion protein)